jgi:hypothetical protein
MDESMGLSASAMNRGSDGWNTAAALAVAKQASSVPTIGRLMLVLLCLLLVPAAPTPISPFAAYPRMLNSFMPACLRACCYNLDIRLNTDAASSDPLFPPLQNR